MEYNKISSKAGLGELKDKSSWRKRSGAGLGQFKDKSSSSKRSGALRGGVDKEKSDKRCGALSGAGQKRGAKVSHEKENRLDLFSLVLTTVTSGTTLSTTSDSILLRRSNEEGRPKSSRGATPDLTRLCDLLGEEKSRSERKGSVGGVEGRAAAAEAATLDVPRLHELVYLGNNTCRPSPSENSADEEKRERRELPPENSSSVTQQQPDDKQQQDLARGGDLSPLSSSAEQQLESGRASVENSVGNASYPSLLVSKELQQQQGIRDLLELASIGEPPPYFPASDENSKVGHCRQISLPATPENKAPAEQKQSEAGVELVTVREVDRPSTLTAQAGSRKEGLAGLVELARRSGISASGFILKASSGRDNIEVKKCIQEKRRSSWERELFHGYLSEPVCYVGEGKPSNPRSSSWEEDLLAGFSNLSLRTNNPNPNPNIPEGNHVQDKHISFVHRKAPAECPIDLVEEKGRFTVEKEKGCPSVFLAPGGGNDCSVEKGQIKAFVSRIPPPPASCYRARMAPIDPHSYTDASHPLTKHVALLLYLDFPSKTISGTATLTLERAYKGEIFLDTRDLTIDSAEDSEKKKSLKFFLDKADAIKGSLLRVVLEDESSVFSVSFKTSPSASALQWLEPSQTAGEKLPYVFTQCQAIHARSIFPCQDTPIARIKYSADVNVPKELSVVMSAAHVGRVSSNSGARVIEKFAMVQPIPPYLFALAAGDITFEEVGPRTRIYAEPSEVKAAAYEFANTEDTVKRAEALFGPYDWERFDLLVMPPSFPYGGMENPRMVFLTPTIIAGDRSGVEVVAHELAHSWTGNLISNATANDFWLNEGFTTYAERRIVEAQEGEERVALHIGLGWQGLEEEVERFKDRPEMTKLKMNLEGVDPDEIYSKIPYEKGFQFLRRLEYQVGRSTFDNFLKMYIAKFRFQSIDTETFLVFLKEKLPKIEEQVDLQTWIHGTGIPDDAIRPKAGVLERVLSLADGFQSGVRLSVAETGKWQAQEWIVYIERLPKKLSPAQISELEEQYHFSESKNWEIKIGFLTIGACSGYKPFYPTIETSLHLVGRMKYLKPLYQGLLESSSEAKELAKKVFDEAKNKYHPIAQVVIQGLLTKYA